MARSRLAQATDQNIYGVSNKAGTRQRIIFKMALTGELTTIHNFDDNDVPTPMN